METVTRFDGSFVLDAALTREESERIAQSFAEHVASFVRDQAHPSTAGVLTEARTITINDDDTETTTRTALGAVLINGV